MSGRRARANRRMRERIAELRDMADIARDHARVLRDEGQTKEAAEWLGWASALYRGTEPVIDAGTAELEKLERGRVWVQSQIDRQVALLRRQEVSWQRIGWALGISPEGARKRYSRPGAA